MELNDLNEARDAADGCELLLSKALRHLKDDEIELASILVDFTCDYLRELQSAIEKVTA